MSKQFTLPQFDVLATRLEQTKNGSILIVSLNRPQAYNALSMELLSELLGLCKALEHPESMLGASSTLPDSFPRVVILTGGEGAAFCSGVDIKAAFSGLGGSSWNYKDIRSQQLLSRLIERMRSIPQVLFLLCT